MEAEQGAQWKHTHPVSDIEETLLIGQVKHQQEAHGISEESCGEAAEPKEKADFLESRCQTDMSKHLLNRFKYNTTFMVPRILLAFGISVTASPADPQG